MEPDTFTVPVPAGTENLTVIIRGAEGKTVLHILAQSSFGVLEIEQPIFSMVLDG